MAYRNPFVYYDNVTVFAAIAPGGHIHILVLVVEHILYVLKSKLFQNVILCVIKFIPKGYFFILFYHFTI